MIKENEMIFGIRAVIEAVQAGKDVDKILVKKDLQGDLFRQLADVLKETDIPLSAISSPSGNLKPISTISKNKRSPTACISTISTPAITSA